MTQGLGTYTFECFIIYFESILRGSLLYGTETFYNITETEYRKIEKIEERLIKQILQTNRLCPTHLMYLALGVYPARFHIYKSKCNFLYDLLHQNEESLLYKFFQAQHRHPVSGDWISDIIKVMEMIGLNLSFIEIKNMNFSKYHKLVNDKISAAAFKYLKGKIKS